MVTGLDEAYAACARIARDHYENFPVASRLLPRRMRPHVAAVYAFARIADDFADEGDRAPEERLALLEGWGEKLIACSAGLETCSAGLKPCGDRTIQGSGTAAAEVSVTAGLQACAAEVFLALGGTIRTCRLPVSLFDDLLSAFRQDVATTRYETWDELLDYCRRSANPVGRLVLGIAGIGGEEAARASDAVCTALQLTNFWQDFARDWRKGRLYLPLEECRRAGADTADLDAGRLTPAWRLALAEAGARTAALFDRGRAVCDLAGGRLGFELRLTWLGGRRILSRLERRGFDVFSGRPALGAADVPALLWQAVTWRAR